MSARNATTTTNVVPAFFQPVPCNCYANTCNASRRLLCLGMEWYVPVAMPICPESLPCHDREDVRHASGWCVCATRRSVTQIATVEMSPLSSAFFVLRESADLDSQCTYKCTGSWTGARCNRFSLSTSRAVPVYGLASTSPVQNNTSSCSTSAKGTVEADLKFELPP